MPKPILGIDFDGVIHSDQSAFVAPSVCSDPPVEGSIEALHEYADPFDLVIFSVRATSPDGNWAIRDYLKKWGAPENLFVTHHKPHARLFIDDHGYQFRGRFPSVSYIQNYQSWHKLGHIPPPEQDPASSSLEAIQKLLDEHADRLREPVEGRTRPVAERVRKLLERIALQDSSVVPQR